LTTITESDSFNPFVARLVESRRLASTYHNLAVTFDSPYSPMISEKLAKLENLGINLITISPKAILRACALQDYLRELLARSGDLHDKTNSFQASQKTTSDLLMCCAAKNQKRIFLTSDFKLVKFWSSVFIDKGIEVVAISQWILRPDADPLGQNLTVIRPVKTKKGLYRLQI